LPPVDPLIIAIRAGRIVPTIRETAGSPARSARATAAIFAFGSLLTLVDALLTRALLEDPGMFESWVPVRMLMEAVGVDLALAICSTLAVGAMAVIAWAAVRARSGLATLSFWMLCAVVSVRVCACVNNIGLISA
jgi:hypothetical protein